METCLYRGEMGSVSFIYFHYQCVWARLMPPASSYATLTAVPCINIYPRDVCPCAAKPLSRKVKFTSFSPLSIFHNRSYTIHAIHQPSQKDGPSTCSSSPGSWIGWLRGGGWRTAAASVAVLILHSRHLGLSDCRQGGGRYRPAITMNWQVLHSWEVTDSVITSFN